MRRNDVVAVAVQINPPLTPLRASKRNDPCAAVFTGTITVFIDEMTGEP